MSVEQFEAWWAIYGPGIVKDPEKTVKKVARLAFMAGAREVTPVVSTFELGSKAPSFSEQVVTLWNAMVTAPIPKARWSADRGKKIDLRCKVLPTIDHWRLAITEMNRTDWCRGEAKSSEHPNWLANLGWFIKKDETVLRFLEAATSKRVTKAIARVPNCKHNPPCQSSIQCSEKYLESLS